MQRFFRAIHGSPATKSEIIGSIVVRHGFQPQRVLMVGDAMEDLEGARRAGARFVGRVHGPDHPFPSEVPTIPDLTDLAAHL